jgi:hypothetical protein
VKTTNALSEIVEATLAASAAGFTGVFQRMKDEFWCLKKRKPIENDKDATAS